MTDTNDKSGKSDADSTDGDNGDKNITQEQLDNIVSKRLNQQKTKHEKEISDLKAKSEAEKAKSVEKSVNKSDGDSQTKPLTAEEIGKMITEGVTAGTNAVMQEVSKNQILASETGLLPAYKSQVKGSNAEEIRDSIKELKETQASDLKASGVSNSPGSFGSGNADSQTNKGKTFTKSEINDPKFYQANKAEILKAGQEGRIIEG